MTKSFQTFHHIVCSIQNTSLYIRTIYTYYNERDVSGVIGSTLETEVRVRVPANSLFVLELYIFQHKEVTNGNRVKKEQ